MNGMVGVRERRWAWIACVLAIAATAALVASPLADALRDTPGSTYHKEKPRRFVPIPDRVPHVAGAYVDRRIKRNLVWIARHFNIYVTEGFAGRLPNGKKVGCPQCHVQNSEHKIGLALDIVPVNTDWSGRCNKPWRSITKLAKWAEPHQNGPLPPFRWVGYNKDEAHGCGDHLHLSWNHHERYRKFKPSRWAEVFRVRARNGDGSGGGDGGGGVSTAASPPQPPPGELRQFEPEG
jgi:hypothetical protein